MFWKDNLMLIKTDGKNQLLTDDLFPYMILHKLGCVIMTKTYLGNPSFIQWLNLLTTKFSGKCDWNLTLVTSWHFFDYKKIYLSWMILQWLLLFLHLHLTSILIFLEPIKKCIIYVQIQIVKCKIKYLCLECYSYFQ